ncbi:MAG: hypothetical protein JO232_13225 [Verrucomicrobia bacterium]|nr:hypothetical protein [Verrucomicrobiota bacterium]
MPRTQLFQLVQVANGHSWDCVRDFKNFLQQTIAEIIEAGTQTGEFGVPLSLEPNAELGIRFLISSSS